ncbi:uncharacterized protein N7498_010393 [Penicillium cinerascens]|uniref:Splicing factor U2AF subunit n=1 Tax=Penicillium cinerascens TaxID=70096 RepID=A0A9W9M764_9EURO|nr:uncharacterized protein N7498_010393 [Penicillium cinerascens]KAJ5191408.1 hypothetical protein N7498_010393 [Penicillium cinerascens]
MNGDTYSSRDSGRSRDYYRDERRDHLKGRSGESGDDLGRLTTGPGARAVSRRPTPTLRAATTVLESVKTVIPVDGTIGNGIAVIAVTVETVETAAIAGAVTLMTDLDAKRAEEECYTPQRKEPTPDLTDVPSILERKRRLTQWDIKPPGYENVTAEQAKLSGMFPLPGAPRQQPMDPSRLQAFMNQPGGSAESTALKPSNSRQSKRLFVYNIPATATEDSIMSFFNLQLNGLNVIHSVDPCISAQIADDRSFALLEFKSPNDATVALAFDGITMAESGDKGLEVRRPKDYIVPGSAEQEYQEGVLLNEVPDSPNKICVSNIPSYIPEEPVTMLLKSFGELKSFVLVKDASTEESRGIAFCEYVDPAATPIAVEGLNGMELGDRHLKVSRASIGTTQASGLDMGVNAMSMFAKTTSQDMETGRVLQLLNMVTVDELLDNEDYEEIKEDIFEECSKFGKILGLKIPRPSSGGRQQAGVGKIYIKFDTEQSATNALKALAGRKFSDRTVVVSYFGEENFDVDAW